VARRLALVGAGLSLLVSAGLLVRLFAIDNVVAFVILIPAVAGALLASSTTKPSAWLVAAGLTSVTALVSLFGFVGLLYVPSIVMFVWSASAPGHEGRAASTRGRGNGVSP
jgi:hypothetical protein